MSRIPGQPAKPLASHESLSEETVSAAQRRQAALRERDGNAALFAAGLCVLGMLVLLVGQLGWWALLAGPAYLAAIAMTVMLGRGRVRALLAVALTTGSMLLLVGMLKLAGLA